jgi:hypothetical protein
MSSVAAGLANGLADVPQAQRETDLMWIGALLETAAALRAGPGSGGGPAGPAAR